MTLRLYNPESSILKSIDQFLSGEDFNKAIANKFEIDFDSCKIDGGIQKYLDGYEISPHPDMRLKAATFMVNINPSQTSESNNHHTHYLKFKKEREYVKKFWEGNPEIDRAWVPWDWMETAYQQTKNNSIALFSPSNDTMHGVKANYNHLETQRTQLYGNLWYPENKTIGNLEWESLDLKGKADYKNEGLKHSIKEALPDSFLSLFRKIKNIGSRNI